MATVIWTSSEAKTLYVREAGNISSGPIAAVMSCDALDVTNYDNTNYRDDFFDPQNSTSNLTVALGGSATATGYVTKGTEAGAFTDGNLGGSGMTVNSASDPVAHIPPRHESKQRTLLRLWSGASGTGNVLYAGWADQVVSFSLAEPSFV
jgi:hypothetical protein